MSELGPPGELAPPLLLIEDLEVVYDGMILALRGVTLQVPRGAIVALLGANGAGKTTTLKAASGLLAAERGEVRRGGIRYRGAPIAGQSAKSLVRQGLVQVLEGRHCFPHLTVEENLLTGAFGVGGRARRRDLERIYALFPRLCNLRRTPSGFASGGEQQMVAMGRALMAKPALILLDEPSMGLSPQIVEQLFELVRSLNHSEGVSFLLAEQNATMALRYADYGYVLENGRVVSSGTAVELEERDDIKQFYLGMGARGRIGFGRKLPRARDAAV